MSLTGVPPVQMPKNMGETPMLRRVAFFNGLLTAPTGKLNLMSACRSARCCLSRGKGSGVEASVETMLLWNCEQVTSLKPKSATNVRLTQLRRRFTKACVTRIAAIALLVTVSAAFGAPAVSLEPAGGQDLRQPFRVVKFTAQNSTAGIVRAISFRSSDGGPTLLVDAVIPPGGKIDGVVPLPALSPQQTYDVTLLSSAQADDAGSPQALAKLQADVTWPKEMVNEDRFVNWRYDPAQSEAVAWWPGELKRNVFLVLVLGSLAMAAVRLLGAGTAPFRSPLAKTDPSTSRFAGYGRWVTLGLIVAGTTMASGWILGRVGLAVNESRWVTVDERARPLLAAGSRRTIQAVYDAQCVPVYGTKDLMQNDSTVIHVAHEATVTLRPGSVHLFEQPEEKPLAVSP